MFSSLVSAVVYSASQPKTETKTKTAAGSNSNKDASSSGQGEVDPKTAAPVCISRDDRPRRDGSLFIRHNTSTMLSRCLCQLGSMSSCVFNLLTLIVSLTVEYTRKEQVTLPFGLGASSTCPHGCCAVVGSAQMGRIDPYWFIQPFVEVVSCHSMYMSSDILVRGRACSNIDSMVTLTGLGNR